MKIKPENSLLKIDKFKIFKLFKLILDENTEIQKCFPKLILYKMFSIHENSKRPSKWSNISREQN